MRSKLILAGLAGILILFLSACSQNTGRQPDLQIGSEINLSGTVVDTIDDCVVDGICAYVVDTDQGRITAIWAEGMQRCEGTMDAGINVGDTVTIRAEATATDTVSICSRATYFIRAA